MKLWLDDERNPADPDIRKRFYSYGSEVWVKTAQQAIDLLRTGEVTEISLDHDLGDISNGTGYDVAKFIEKSAYMLRLKPPKWWIHSANPVGRINMMVALANADNHWLNAITSGKIPAI